ncbi:MAG: isoleucine--tRNA ligase, partial [Nitrospira sp.]|nr:isoleucine--tRNA ligase [Nitrospira sp.]
FPEVHARWKDDALATRWEKLLAYRTRVQGELEVSRRDKLIGSSLEAHVRIEAGPDAHQFLTAYARELGTIFIVSCVTLVPAPTDSSDIRITVEKSVAAKCERCWNYRDAVGKDRDHPTLCERCVEAVL